MKELNCILCSIALLAFISNPGVAQAPAIILPDVLAVEMPKGVVKLGPTQSPLREMLMGARDGTKKISWDLNHEVGLGPIRVTWSAWEGPVGARKPSATRTARLFVFPFGITPVGVSGDENATAGNNAVHISRDITGRVHMVWQDGGRPGGKTGAVYRRAAVSPDGSVKFETEPIYIAEQGPADWNAYPSLAVAGTKVQLAWQGAGTVRTRRITLSPTGWTMGKIIDTQAKSDGRDIGAAIAFDPKGGLHIATPAGVYAYSTDDGKSWKTETIPLPPHEKIKTQSLTVSPEGMVDVAMSAVVDRVNPPSGKPGGYWQLRTIRRTADGHWVDPTDVLANQPNWKELKGSDDMLADWVRIATDRQGGLHLAWHGTANSHKISNDASFYAFRKRGGSWSTPVQLVPQDPSRGIKFSFAPSLALDGDRALALTFYDVYAGTEWYGFDSRLVPLRNGHSDGQPIQITQFVQAAIAAKHPDQAMGVRFPGAAPELWKTANSAGVLDVIGLLQSPFEPKGANLIVYERFTPAGTSP